MWSSVRSQNTGMNDGSSAFQLNLSICVVSMHALHFCRHIYNKIKSINTYFCMFSMSVFTFFGCD